MSELFIAHILIVLLRLLHGFLLPILHCCSLLSPTHVQNSLLHLYISELRRCYMPSIFFFALLFWHMVCWLSFVCFFNSTLNVVSCFSHKLSMVHTPSGAFTKPGKNGSVAEGQLLISLFSIKPHFLLHFESRRTIYSYLDFSLKIAVFGCLTNALAPLPIALGSCSMAQTDQQVF